MPELGDFENLQVLVNNPKVCLNALSTSLIGIFPITRSTATSERVARLSVITTESLNKPESLPADESKLINTRLGWLARNTRLVIIATMTWVDRFKDYPFARSKQDGVWRLSGPNAGIEPEQRHLV